MEYILQKKLYEWKLKIRWEETLSKKQLEKFFIQKFEKIIIEIIISNDNFSKKYFFNHRSSSIVESWNSDLNLWMKQKPSKKKIQNLPPKYRELPKKHKNPLRSRLSIREQSKFVIFCWFFFFSISISSAHNRKSNFILFYRFHT